MGYEIFEGLCAEKGVTPYKVSQETGISTASLSNWKAGRYAPKAEKLLKIADYFGVSVEYLSTGKDEAKHSNSGRAYYFNDETAEAAQRLFERKDLRALMDSASTLPADKVEALANMALVLKGTNPDG